MFYEDGLTSKIDDFTLCQTFKHEPLYQLYECKKKAQNMMKGLEFDYEEPGM